MAGVGGLDYNYTLDDKSEAMVQVEGCPGHELISIGVFRPGKKDEWLYVRPLKYSN